VALRDSLEAIGAVTELLRSRLTLAAGVVVDVGRPEVAANSDGEKLNLFLYQIDFDPHLRNEPYDEGLPIPLWLVLRYLLTAADEKESDSSKAHRLLGRGLAALQALNFVRPETSIPALADNPEPLKITFDSADAELLSKIMQGTDEKYRLSAAFQIRPVMIVPDEPPAYAPVVLTVGPPGREGVAVAPSLGARLAAVEPERFTSGSTLVLKGEDLFSNVHRLALGTLDLPLALGPGGRIQAVLPPATVISPGPYPLQVFRTTPAGRRVASNAVLGHVVPHLVSAVPGGLTPQAGGRVSGTLTLAGECLGDAEDDILVAFYRDGAVAHLAEPAGVAAQNALVVTVTASEALPGGTYLILLRVNGEQAAHSPEVAWT
jgi:hypothetical protein